MENTPQNKKLIAGAALAALVLGGGGYMLGKSGSAPAPTTAAPAEDHEAEEEHGPEGFIEMDDARAKAAGIITEAVQAGGLSAEVIAQGVAAATSEGEAVLTARTDGTVVRITQHLGDTVRAGETIALLESREAATLVADLSVAASRVNAARLAYNREQRLYNARVTARQDFEAAQASLAEAQAELRRTQAAAAASGLSGNGRTLAIVTPVGGRLTRADARLGAYVLAGTEMFRVADPNQVQINASALPGDARRIQPGDTAVIEMVDGSLSEAVVHSVTPALDAESKTATIVLRPKSVAGLTPGQGMRVRIRPSQTVQSTAIALPDEAVQSIEGRHSVFVKTKDGFQATEVTIGERSGGRIEILSGIKPGAIVASKGAFLLKAELGKGEAEH